LKERNLAGLRHDHTCAMSKHYGIIASVFLVMLFARQARAIGANVPKMEIGVQTHFAQNKGNPVVSFPLILQAGATSPRDEVYWSIVEREKGKLVIPPNSDDALSRAFTEGMNPVVILDYGNRFYDSGKFPLSDEAQDGFVRYAEFVARHFKGRVKLYEVWNEWNIGTGVKGNKAGQGWDARAYVKLLHKTYQALKNIDPSIKVLGGAIAGWDTAWLEEMAKADGLKSLDGVSIHPYSYNSRWQGRPEVVIDWLAEREQALRRLSGAKEVPFYITEIGWPTHVGELGSSPDLSAAYLARFYLYGRTKPFIKGIWWYDFQDDGSERKNPEHNFGLVRTDLTPKPSYFALRDIASLVRDADFVERLATDDKVYALKFRQPDGATSIAVWADDPGKNARLRFSFVGTASSAVTVRKVGRGLPTVTRDLGATGRILELTTGGEPWVIQGRFDRVGLSVTWEDAPEESSFFLTR
jgi:polysaccharide biosynthesis protein PslG